MAGPSFHVLPVHAQPPNNIPFISQIFEFCWSVSEVSSGCKRKESVCEDIPDLMIHEVVTEHQSVWHSFSAPHNVEHTMPSVVSYHKTKV